MKWIIALLLVVNQVSAQDVPRKKNDFQESIRAARAQKKFLERAPGSEKQSGNTKPLAPSRKVK